MMKMKGIDHIVRGAAPITTNSKITADYISMKNVLTAWIVVTFTQAVGHATGIDPVQATGVGGSDPKAFVKTLPIWANEDCAAASTLAEQTAAITYNVTNDIKNKIVVIKIDAEKLDVANSFDCIGCTIDASSQGTNYATINYFLRMRYDDVEVITD